jgi:UDP-N-acetylmuramate--alanine ligase
VLPKLELGGTEHVHIIGIGGAGMSAIARVLLGRGHAVSGSDLSDSAFLRELSHAGARVFVGHSPSHVQGADVVAVTSAAPPDNPEVLEARRLGLPLLPRGEILRRLTAGKRCLAVAGTHGKTTTTAMIATLLRHVGLDPSFIVGGESPDLGTNGYAGGGNHFVIEADEYDYTFLALQPTLAVVTNVEWDHVDCYPDLRSVQQAFGEFVNLVSPDGALFLCRDDPGAWSLQRPSIPVISYGFSSGATWWASEMLLEPHGSIFTVVREGRAEGRFRLGIPGAHNVLNALAALSVVAWEGVDLQQVREPLASFAGVQRRFQQLGIVKGVAIVDDYAHHPSEIVATLSAARQRFPGRRLVAVFQPHTYSRTLAFEEEFAQALCMADVILITRIYAAREMDPGEITGERLAEKVSKPATYVPTLTQALNWLLEHLQPGDVLLTLGAGDITEVGPRVIRHLQGQGEGTYGSA